MDSEMSGSSNALCYWMITLFPKLIKGLLPAKSLNQDSMNAFDFGVALGKFSLGFTDCRFLPVSGNVLISCFLVRTPLMKVWTWKCVNKQDDESSVDILRKKSYLGQRKIKIFGRPIFFCSIQIWSMRETLFHINWCQLILQKTTTLW